MTPTYPTRQNTTYKTWFVYRLTVEHVRDGVTVTDPVEWKVPQEIQCRTDVQCVEAWLRNYGYGYAVVRSYRPLRIETVATAGPQQ